MGIAAAGSISGVPWSTEPEASYDVIVSSLEINNNAEQAELQDEDMGFVLSASHSKVTEIQFECAIKGSNHFGARSLVGSMISTFGDNDIPTPIVVTTNSHSKSKGEWQTCRMTGRYYDSDFTTGTLLSELAGGTTTTTTT